MQQQHYIFATRKICLLCGERFLTFRDVFVLVPSQVSKNKGCNILVLFLVYLWPPTIGTLKKTLYARQQLKR